MKQLSLLIFLILGSREITASSQDEPACADSQDKSIWRKGCLVMTCYKGSLKKTLAEVCLKFLEEEVEDVLDLELLTTTKDEGPVVKQFEYDLELEDEEGPQFKHLVVDEMTGSVYLGGQNRLYQLTPNLELKVVSTTGPKMDSPYCPPPGLECPPSVNERLTNNMNKALLIDYANSRLISCGSLFQGVCETRSLQNISNVEHQSKEFIVANTAEASTVAFIAPGSPDPPNTQVMYVGVSYTKSGPYRSEVPAVSSRSLNSNNLFKVAHTNITSGTRMYVNSLARERYPINYIFGFSSEGFSYFLTTQMEKSSPSPFQTKLVRVCQGDPDYYSYTEVPLGCHGKTKPYALAQAAYVGKPGSTLAAELDITTQDDVLFATFSTPEDYYSDTPSKDSSALCVFSLKTIRGIFMFNIEQCLAGTGNTGLDFISPSKKCIDTKLSNIGDDFCGLDVNTPLGGIFDYMESAELEFDTQLTAVAATSTGESTVVFVGTNEGHLKKILVDPNTRGSELEDIPVVPGKSIGSNLLFDLQHHHLYAMTDKKVSKVRVQECSKYKDCNQCLQVKDPYCGWCKASSSCDLKEKCGSGKDGLWLNQIQEC